MELEKLFGVIDYEKNSELSDPDTRQRFVDFYELLWLETVSTLAIENECKPEELPASLVDTIRNYFVRQMFNALISVNLDKSARSQDHVQFVRENYDTLKDIIKEATKTKDLRTS